MTTTPDDQGYCLASSDGGVTPFGNAQFYGSMASSHLTGPAASLARTPSGNGYWLTSATSAVYAFDTPFDGPYAAGLVAQRVGSFGSATVLGVRDDLEEGGDGNCR
jgi:hypothetical protein